MTHFSDLAAGIVADPCKLDPIDPVHGPVKSFTEIEADFIARGEPVPRMVKQFAEVERGDDDDPRLAGLRVTWRARKIQ